MFVYLFTFKSVCISILPGFLHRYMLTFLDVYRLVLQSDGERLSAVMLIRTDAGQVSVITPLIERGKERALTAA